MRKRISIAALFFSLIFNVLLACTVWTQLDEIKSKEQKISAVINLVNHQWIGSEFTDVDHLLKTVRPVDRRKLDCMATNIYREAATQSMTGKLAVGHVVINRAKSQKYPDDVCAVIHQKNKINKQYVCQFSWVCMKNLPAIDKNSLAWKQSIKVAYSLLFFPSKLVLDNTQGATHYHTNSVSPEWKYSLTPTASIEQHEFYKTKIGKL